MGVKHLLWKYKLYKSDERSWIVKKKGEKDSQKLPGSSDILPGRQQCNDALFGVFGPSKINVLKLNVALDEHKK